MSYVLILGVKYDPVLQYFYQQPFIRKDKRFIFINEERIGKDIFLSHLGWELPCGSFLPHSHVSAVYNRLYLSGHNHIAQSYLQWLLDEVYPKVLNRPKHTLSNFSKPWQLLKAKAIGLKIPPTTIEANRVVSQGQVGPDRQDVRIYKSVSSVRSIVKSVSTNTQNQVHEPVLFQKDMGRVNIRVHMLRDRTSIIAQEIESQAVDYRYDIHASKAKVFQLPGSIIKKLESLACEFGLVLSGSDFMSHKGSLYFLEMNPSPGYAYYEKQVKGTPLSQKIYEYLIS
ncbi:MAG: hypothetical protein VXW87_04175 [Pseudomonadota bacterium]|nr:hypothetical protein [Pseudomonadota bacterium]